MRSGDWVIKPAPRAGPMRNTSPQSSPARSPNAKHPAQPSGLQEAHSRGKLTAELARLRRYSLLIVDEVGYIPFDQDAANLFFQLVASRYEHASLILTSNLSFGRWGEVFGDQTVASAMIDRIVHHADVLSLKGTSYRMKSHRPATDTA
jgi:DNA replication protein DnaC